MSMYMPGATAVGITFDNGVVVASEKRVAYGNFLVSKTTKKTFSLTDKVGVTIAGLVADMQLLVLHGAKARCSTKLDCKDDV
jgi:proteasome beta subunit